MRKIQNIKIFPFKVTCYLQSAASMNASLTISATSYCLLLQPGFLLIHDEKFSDSLNCFKFGSNVAIYELCGGVYSIFAYLFCKNRRMKTLPTAVAINDQTNRIVWRWVNISPKPF
jgi:hypothetical protein